MNAVTDGQPRLCVVITCYNQPGLLHEAIMSVIDQTVSCGLVLVNDGCPLEATDALCRAARNAYPDRILYVVQRNGGTGSARNVGIRVALSAWPGVEAVLFLDGDNRLSPGTLERMHAALIASGADWVFPDLAIMGSPRLKGMAGEYSVIELILQNYIDSSSLVARRVLESGVRFDATLPAFEDWDFWLQAAEKGYRGAYAYASGFQYRSRPASQLQSGLRDCAVIYSRIFDKHRSFVSAPNCVRLEHAELPRYALVTDGSADVALFTDPCRRERRMPRAAFVERLAYAASGEYRRLPSFIVSADSAALAKLEKHKLLRGLFWHLEYSASAVEAGVALNVSPSGMCRIEDLGLPRRGEPAIIMLPIRALHTPRPEASGRGQAPAPQLSLLTSLQTPLHPANNARIQMQRLLAELRQAPRISQGLAPLKGNQSGRLREPTAARLSALFRTEALFPIASSGVRTGFLLRDDLPQRSRNHFAALAAAAAACGHSIHLVWLRTGNIPRRLPESCFDSVTPISLAAALSIENVLTPSPLLGLLAALHCVVNCECPELLHLNGTLRRGGATVAYASLGVGEECSGYGQLEGAISYEYDIDHFLPGSERLKTILRGAGISERKFAKGPELVFAGVSERGGSFPQPDMQAVIRAFAAQGERGQ